MSTLEILGGVDSKLSSGRWAPKYVAAHWEKDRPGIQHLGGRVSLIGEVETVEQFAKCCQALWKQSMCVRVCLYNVNGPAFELVSIHFKIARVSCCSWMEMTHNKLEWMV